MLIRKTIIASATAAAIMMLFSAETFAQTVSAKVGINDKNEKKEEPKEKVVEKVVEKSGPSVEQELKRLFGFKSETSLTGPRVENIGKYFLDTILSIIKITVYCRNLYIFSILSYHLKLLNFTHTIIGIEHNNSCPQNITKSL